MSAQQKYKYDASMALKAEGNRLHGQRQYREAAAKYSRAVANLEGMASREAADLRLACQNNLSNCHLQLGEWASCVELCGAVLAADGANRKALYRRGQAYSGMGRHEAAVADLERALELSPGDERPVVAEKLEEARQALAQAERLQAQGRRRVTGSAGQEHELLHGSLGVCLAQAWLAQELWKVQERWPESVWRRSLANIDACVPGRVRLTGVVIEEVTESSEQQEKQQPTPEQAPQQQEQQQKEGLVEDGCDFDDLPDLVPLSAPLAPAAVPQSSTAAGSGQAPPSGMPPGDPQQLQQAREMVMVGAAAQHLLLAAAMLCSAWSS